MVGFESTCVTVVDPLGSRSLVRLVALKIPIPMRTMTPTPIQVLGTFNRYAPNASPTVRTRKPTRYEANDDIGASHSLKTLTEEAIRAPPTEREISLYRGAPGRPHPERGTTNHDRHQPSHRHESEMRIRH